MFTGLIQEVGTIVKVASGAMADLWVQSSFAQEVVQGESIAVDGVCLTAVERSGQTFRVQASPETLRRTTLGSLAPSSKINLERAMKLGDRLGGHLVLGHVDAVAQVLDRREEGGSLVMGFSLSPAMAAFFIEKGSVALDGISLTVNDVQEDRFHVAIIPETRARTTIAQKPIGARVNLESDVIGKYIARLHQLGQRVEASKLESGEAMRSGITEESLRAAGFGSDD